LSGRQWGSPLALDLDAIAQAVDMRLEYPKGWYVFQAAGACFVQVADAGLQIRERFAADELMEIYYP
jgi:hypothetical protein